MTAESELDFLAGAEIFSTNPDPSTRKHGAIPPLFLIPHGVIIN